MASLLEWRIDLVLTDKKADVFDANGVLHSWPYDLIDSTMKFAYQCQHVPTGHTTRELAYFENWAAFCSCIKLWDEDMPGLWRFSKLPSPELEQRPKADSQFEYDVWGGYQGQDHGDHWATFETLEEAIAYKTEMESGNAKLTLHVKQTKRQR